MSAEGFVTTRWLLNGEPVTEEQTAPFSIEVVGGLMPHIDIDGPIIGRLECEITFDPPLNGGQS